MGYPSGTTCGACGSEQKVIRDEERVKHQPCKQCGAVLEVAPGAMATHATYMGAETHAADRTWSVEEVEARRVAARYDRLKMVASLRAQRMASGVRADVDQVYGLRDLVMAYLVAFEAENEDYDMLDSDWGKARRAAMADLQRVLAGVYEVDMGAEDVGSALGRHRVLAHHHERHARGAWSLVRDAVDVCGALRSPFPGLIMGTPIDQEDFVLAMREVHRGRTTYRAMLVAFIVKAIEALLGGPQPTYTSSDLLDWGYDDRQFEPYRKETYA